MIDNDEAFDLVDTDRLLRALSRRYAVWVFAAASDKAKDADGIQIITMRTNHNGDRLRVIGLCHYLAAALSRELEADFVDDEP